MCMNGPLIIMAFDPLFGLWPSSFFVSSWASPFHSPKLVKNLQKQSTSKIYVQTQKRPIIGAEVRMVSVFDINFMPLSKLNKG